MRDDDANVTFKLNGKRPDDFTIDRLAQYVRVLGELVGSPGKVRIRKILPGSVKAELAVEREYYPSFVERLATAKNPDRASAAMRRTVCELGEMIQADHVSAEIKAGQQKLFYLQSTKRDTGLVVGPVIQRLTVRGQIIGLEGKDQTKHVRLAEYGTKREIRGELRDMELATRLTAHLWGRVLDLTGVARMMRHPNGIWEMKTYRVDGMQLLEDVLPGAALRGLHNALSSADGDAVLLLKKLRG
jgi:hypothetical protein